MTNGSAVPRGSSLREHPRARQLGIRTLAVLGVLAILEVLTRVGIVTAPPPIEVLARFLDFGSGDHLFWRSLLVTVAELMLGWLIGLLIAVPLGLLIGGSRGLTAATATTIAWFRLLPIAAVVPLVAIELRNEFATAVALVAFAAGLVMLRAVIEGMHNVNARSLALARSYGLTRWQCFHRVTLPSALPSIDEGQRRAATTALAVVLLSELAVRGEDGLGARISQLFGSGLKEEAAAFVLTVVLLAFMVRGATWLLGRWLVRWPVPRQPEPARSRVTFIQALALPVILVAAWSLVAAIGHAVTVPSPIEVLASFVNTWLQPRLFTGLVTDVAQFLLAFSAAGVIGTALAMLMFALPFARAVIGPFLRFSAAVPMPLWAVFTLIGMRPWWLIVVGCSWPVFSHTLASLDTAAQPRAQTPAPSIRVRNVFWSAAAPGAARGMRASLGAGLNLMVLIGLAFTRSGWGGALGEAIANFSIADAWAEVMLLGAVSCALAWVMRSAERRMLRRKESPDAHL